MQGGTTDKVLAEMAEWSARPLDPVYPVLFIDAIHVKIRDGQVANRPVYVAVGVTTAGERDILGLWAGDGGEGAKFWLAVLTEIKNRGVEDVCIAVCDGLKGLPEAITTVWPPTVVQTCLIHLLRNTFRFAARQYWDDMSRDLRPIYTAPTEAAAKERFGEFAGKWGPRYPAIVRMRKQLVGVCAVSRLRRRDPPGDLLDERDRVAQRPVSEGDPGAWAFPERASRAQMPVSGHPCSGPDRQGARTMDITVERSLERFRDHLRRTHHPEHQLIPCVRTGSTDYLTVPFMQISVPQLGFAGLYLSGAAAWPETMSVMVTVTVTGWGVWAAASVNRSSMTSVAVRRTCSASSRRSVP